MRATSTARAAWRLVAAGAVALGVLALAPAASAGGGQDVRVMTRNIYLGADLTGAIVAPTREAFEASAAQIVRDVRATDFPARSRLLAAEIAATRPDLVGLQEVALWRRTPRGGGPARIVMQDFLAILQRALRARGQRYRAAVVSRAADIQVPTALGYEVRMTLRDVILVRGGSGLRVTGRSFARYRAALRVPTAVGTLVSRRTWTAVDVRRGRTRLRFVNTHLEAFSASVRAAQARELVRGPLRRRRQTIVLGDMNSDPADPGPEGEAYRVIRAAGFADAWSRAHPARRGLTCCFSALLRDRRPDLTSRIDLVLARGGPVARRVARVGADPAQRTRTGLWPSDHLGVVAAMRLRAPRRAPAVTGRRVRGRAGGAREPLAAG